jgi:hypothetical protein
MVAAIEGFHCTHYRLTQVARRMQVPAGDAIHPVLGEVRVWETLSNLHCSYACIVTYILLPVLEYFNSLSTCSARLPSPASEPRSASHNALRVGFVGCSFVGH